jgi:hypothetical protein
MASEAKAVMPITAKQALEQWNAGKDVPAFQVEGNPERQREIFAVAFDMIGGDYSLTQDLAELRRVVPAGDLTDREFETAHSIAYVAMKVGWSKMVSQHIHRDSPAITISKQKD